MIGATLSVYLFGRFSKAILGVFGTVVALIALADFIEMFRRASEVNVSGLQVGLLTMLRVPSLSEQILPFAVLGGSMIAFVGLSRRLELVVARAAGVSVWQFMAPPAAVAALIGFLSVTAYNPVAAALKDRADQIETTLFGGLARSNVDTSLWIQQQSVDGQAILRAESSSDRGSVLGGVSVFAFNKKGQFVERIEADRAQLFSGYWRLEHARITAPDQQPKTDPTYLLATNLTPQQVTQSFVDPDSVAFWELPNIVHETELAGLDPTTYRLRYDTLLARPLLLVAMVLIAACFSLRFFRFGGIARTASGGVVAGFVLYVATKLVADLGGAGLLTASIAAWSPALVASMLGALVLLYREDG